LAAGFSGATVDSPSCEPLPLVCAVPCCIVFGNGDVSLFLGYGDTRWHRTTSSVANRLAAICLFVGHVDFGKSPLGSASMEIQSIGFSGGSQN
jgi:hypothetical protein